MIRTYTSYLIIVMVALLQSCNLNLSEDKGEIVARVGDYYLYDQDISKLIKDDVSKSDSALIADRIIERWARKKILLKKAELNLSAKEADFNKLIEEYREGLITSAYRQKLVSQYLDTLVTSEDVSDYYSANKSNFILNNDLLMLKYVVFPANISEKRKLVKLFKSDKPEDLAELESLCYQFSNDFSISDSVWVPLNEAKIDIPHLKDVRKSLLLKKGNFIEKQDSLSLYLTRITDVKKKNEIAPLVYVDELINNIILNRRKLELMKSMESQLVEDAVKNGEFETFNK